jgi:MATE family multidrug resistance protein
MVPLAGLIDLAFLGHLAEIHHLAGVALASIIFNYVYWSFGFLRMGTTGATAQAVGRGNRSDMVLVGLRNAAIAVVLGAGLLLLQWPLRELGFAVLNAAPDVRTSGEAFYDARIWGSPAVLLNFVLIGWFLGKERVRQVLLISAVVNGSNVILDYWFITRLGWESAGAGWATALAQYLALGIGLLAVCRETSWAELRAIAPQFWERRAFISVFQLNGDILIRSFALTSAFSLFTSMSAALGTVILATNTLLLQVVTLAAYFIDGLAFATESIAGLIRGRGHHHQLMPLIKFSGGTSIGIGILFALPFILLPDAFFSLLTDHRSVLAQVDQYVVWLLPILGFGSVAFMLDGYFLGLTEGRILRNSTLIATVIGFIPIALLAQQLQESQLLWLAMTVLMAVRAVTLSLKVPVTLSAVDPG